MSKLYPTFGADVYWLQWCCSWSGGIVGECPQCHLLDGIAINAIDLHSPNIPNTPERKQVNPPVISMFFCLASGVVADYSGVTISTVDEALKVHFELEVHFVLEIHFALKLPLCTKSAFCTKYALPTRRKICYKKKHAAKDSFQK